MRPHFDQADRRVGRDRLPPGYVAILDDADRLAAGVTELHTYAVAGAGRPQRRLGVLFRRVGTADRDAVRNRLIAEFGPAALLEQASHFGVDETYHYVLDTEGIAHAWHRHANPVADPVHGQVPLERVDLDQLADAVQPRHIVEFAVVKGVPRTVHHWPCRGGVLVVVLEVQHRRRWLVVRTIYKLK